MLLQRPIAPNFQTLRVCLWDYSVGASRVAPWEAPPASVASAACGTGMWCGVGGIAPRLACNVGAEIRGALVYIVSCEMLLNGQRQFDDHVLGKKHSRRANGRVSRLLLSAVSLPHGGIS